MEEHRVAIGIKKLWDGRREVSCQDLHSGRIIKSGLVVKLHEVEETIQALRRTFQRAGYTISVREL